MTQPNIFLLTVDSLRADAVFGDHIPTPNIAGHAARGTAFHQCISTTTTTTPSFSSILTGCYPPKHGVRGLQGYTLSPALKTMAELFGDAGYHTCAEVTGPLLPETGILRGFSETRHRQAYRVPFFNWRDHVVDKLSSLAQPWLFLLHVWEVHRPYRAPPTFAKRYDKAGYEAAVAATDQWLRPVFDAVPDNTITTITGDHGEEYPDSRLQRGFNRGARAARRLLHLSKWFPWLDKRIGGEALGHGFGLNEALVRVPLIVSGPGVPESTVTAQVRHIDLLPTLAALAGLDAPPGIDGRSLEPLTKGGSLPEEPAYMEAVGVKLGGKRIVGVRTSEWKLLRGSGRRPALYRLAGTPDERRNLYRRHPEVVRELEAYIERVSSVTGAPGSGMTTEEEAVVEQHLRDLGYL